VAILVVVEDASEVAADNGGPVHLVGEDLICGGGEQEPDLFGGEGGIVAQQEARNSRNDGGGRARPAERRVVFTLAIALAAGDVGGKDAVVVGLDGAARAWGCHIDTFTIV
jgi:hypothetical protein